MEDREATSTNNAPKKAKKWSDLGYVSLYATVLLICIGMTIWQTTRGNYILALGDVLITAGMMLPLCLTAAACNSLKLATVLRRGLLIIGAGIVIAGMFGVLRPQRQYYITYEYVVHAEPGDISSRTQSGASWIVTNPTYAVTSKNVENFIDRAKAKATESVAEHFQVPEEHITITALSFFPLEPS